MFAKWTLDSNCDPVPTRQSVTCALDRDDSKTNQSAFCLVQRKTGCGVVSYRVRILVDRDLVDLESIVVISQTISWVSWMRLTQKVGISLFMDPT